MLSIELDILIGYLFAKRSRFRWLGKPLRVPLEIGLVKNFFFSPSFLYLPQKHLSSFLL